MDSHGCVILEQVDHAALFELILFSFINSEYGVWCTHIHANYCHSCRL